MWWSYDVPEIKKLKEIEKEQKKKKEPEKRKHEILGSVTLDS